MLDTVGVLSILEPDLTSVVKGLWDRLEREFGCSAVRVFPYPNLTLQAGQTTDVPALEADVALWTRHIGQFEISVEGLGTFPTPSPTIFLRVHASDVLRALNHDLTRIFSRHCPKLIAHYQPPDWIPHITLAMEDLKSCDLDRACQVLSSHDLEYRQLTTDMTLARRCGAGNPVEVVRRWSLSVARSRQYRSFERRSPMGGQ